MQPDDCFFPSAFHFLYLLQFLPLFVSAFHGLYATTVTIEFPSFDDHKHKQSIITHPSNEEATMRRKVVSFLVAYSFRGRNAVLKPSSFQLYHDFQKMQSFVSFNSVTTPVAFLWSCSDLRYMILHQGNHLSYLQTSRRLLKVTCERA